ncbi:hypothetical protein F0U60_54300 [Archangium minus]|uniref:Uncharacterized protein n=1 Tax=Archangium minus TaxID=83450 RepID=A0ABY9X9L8_9BACT|nr:hypothetical protein F0U60_54300 [Archangium minus]
MAGDALHLLERELEVLERSWAPLAQVGPDSSNAPSEARSLSLHEHLLERVGFLRAAIRVAREAGGFVRIG